MAAVYTQRLFLGSVAAASSITIYTAPSGVIVVIRDISFIPFGGSTPWEITLGINGTFFYQEESTTAPAFFHWEGRAVMEAGDEITCNTNSGGLDGQITGYVLSTP
jgi:hypothetical protein